MLNEHPTQPFRARELHEPAGGRLLGLPTDEATVNITRSRFSRPAGQGFLTQPGRGLYQKRMQRPLSELGSAWSTAATLA